MFINLFILVETLRAIVDEEKIFFINCASLLPRLTAALSTYVKMPIYGP